MAQTWVTVGTWSLSHKLAGIQCFVRISYSIIFFCFILISTFHIYIAVFTEYWALFLQDFHPFAHLYIPPLKISNGFIKRPARDACLCMGDFQAPPAPHFVFLITL